MPKATTSAPSDVQATPELFALGRQALLDITTADTLGEPAGSICEGDGVITLYFATTVAAYTGWRWTVSIAQLEGQEPSVLETELTPGDSALLSPDWVPWIDRLADYKEAQAAIAAELAEADADDDVDDDDSDDDFDDDDDDDDDGGSDVLHAGDLDGVDIDSLDDAELADAEGADVDETDAAPAAKAGSAKAATRKPATAKAASVTSEPSKAGAAKRSPAKASSAKSGSAKTGSAKSGSAKTGAAKSVAAKGDGESDQPKDDAGEASKQPAVKRRRAQSGQTAKATKDDQPAEAGSRAKKQKDDDKADQPDA